MRQLLLIGFLMLGLNLTVHATHIIGGEITYSCLGNNQYEVSLTVFRDCYNGVPPFDDTVSIGVFNYKNELIYDIRIPYMKDDTIKQTLIGDCKVIPPNVCVHTSVYRDTVELKPILGGYTLVYQRCCRNKTIANIVKPDETGASFIIQISEKALLECNSSAKFKYWPPIYICANEPIIFDHSAFDPDGDSIVYKLCVPTNGLQDIPQPQPPSPPPYDKVVWNDPPYNLNNLMGGVPLMINSKTGLLTGVPSTIGQFVVGICIEEYRDGKQISTTTRDFQYNVGLCGVTASSFFVPDVNCDGLVVNFSNLSQNANKFYWDFGDPTTNTDMSSIFNPSYTYPDTGTYTISLIAQASETCRDTISKTIKVYKNSLIPDYKIKLLTCTDSMVVAITDASIDTLSKIVSWKYYLRIGGVLKDSSTLKNPVFVGDTLGIWEITLIIENEFGCVKSKKRSIVFPKLIKFQFPTDTLTKCFNQDLQILVPNDSTYTYTWLPGQYLSDSTISSPICSTPVNKQYTLKIKDKGSVCNISRDLWVNVAPKILLDLPDTIITCEKEIKIGVKPNVELAKVYFSFLNDFSSILDSTIDITIKNLSGNKTLYVKAIDEFGCEIIDSVYLFGQGIFYQNPVDRIICPGDSVNTEVLIQSGQQIFIDWTPDIDLITNNFSAEAKPADIGDHYYYYKLYNNYGCLLSDSFNIFVVDTLPSSFVTYNQCAGNKVYIEGTGINAKYYNWSVDTGDSIVFYNATPFFVNFIGPGNYQVKSWIPGIICLDTLISFINVAQGNLSLSYKLNVPTCQDSLILELKNTSLGYNPLIHNAYWSTSSNGLITADSFAIVFKKTDPSFKFSLIIDQNNGCIDTLSKEIFASFIPKIPDDTLSICSGKSIQLDYDTLSGLIFNWEPASFFSNPNISSPIVTLDVNTVLIANLMTLPIDTFTCSSSFKVNVNVLQSPQYTLDYDSIICSSTTTLYVNTDFSNTVTWYASNDFKNELATASTLEVTPGRYEDYYGIIVGTSGCADTFKVEIKNLLPDILPNPVILCAGDTAIVSYINLIAGDSLTCIFDPSNLVFIDPATGNTVVTASSSFDLMLTCTNQFGCSITKSLPVEVFEYMPPLVVSASPDTITLGNSSQLTSTFDNNYIYSWFPSNTLSAANIFNPIATPTANTTYTLNIVNQDGCRNEASLNIVVINPICEEPFHFIPNAFSPNGDGKNDKFYVRGEFITEIKLSIYNRWGQLVFYTEDKNEGWDGNFQGKVSAQDVYGYQVEFLCADGQQYFKKGNLTLIR
jgi:gliding motility-associated-like protein